MADVLKFSFSDSLLGTPEELHEQLSGTYWNYFCGTCIFEEGAERLLSVLPDSYALGIVSNGVGEAQRRRLQAGGIEGRFRAVIVSDEVGVRKPAAGIFERALEEFGARREEVLFVGDSIQDDYMGSVRAGIDFCYYNRSRSELPAGVEPKFVVTELPALTNLLE
jgi:FMN phosphatase YigB (HAD superfamily)